MVSCIADNPNLPILPKCVSPITIIHIFNFNFSYSRFQEDGDLRAKQRTGAPRKTTADLDRAIVQRSINNPKMTFIEIARTEGV